MFTQGDRVRYIGKNKTFIRQCGDRVGTFQYVHSLHDNWGQVAWDMSDNNLYPLRDLELDQVSNHHPMTPEFELD